MNDLTHDIGLLRREVRDLRGLTSNLDRKVLRLIEGTSTRITPALPAAAAILFVARVRRQLPEAVPGRVYRNGELDSHGCRLSFKVGASGANKMGKQYATR